MDKWSKEDKAELRKFWESPVGQKYKKRVEDTVKQLSNSAMGAQTPDESFRYSMIANGFQSVLGDFEYLTKKEEKTAKK